MVKWLVNWKEEKGCPCLRHVLQGYIHYWHNVGRTNQIKGQPFSNWKARFQKSFMSNNSKTGASILISNSLSVSLQKEVRPAAVFKNKGCCVKNLQCLKYVNSKWVLFTLYNFHFYHSSRRITKTKFILVTKSARWLPALPCPSLFPGCEISRHAYPTSGK